jgi:uncharacterized protein YjbI with pentapeptide repeats
VIEMPQRPKTDDRAEWKAYWQAQGMPWRTEPEIDEQRQVYLAGQQAKSPDREKGIYPCRDEHGGIKLDRADVEWLLATQEGGRGPIDWGDEGQRQREGLDLRGADVSGVVLSGLPLARLRGGLSAHEWHTSNEVQRESAAIHLESAILNEAHIEGAVLRRAHLEQAQLRGAHLELADLHRAYLSRAYLPEAYLMGADALGAHLEAAYLAHANVAGADLREAFCDTWTDLADVIVWDAYYGGISLADVRWAEMNLAVVDWTRATPSFLGMRKRIEAVDLGDEREARAATNRYGKAKGHATRLREYRAAVRANRQLATALRSQGLNEDADRFAYKAQTLQREVLRRQGRLGSALGSWFLDVIAGYGYRPMRAFVAYALVIALFTGLYLLNSFLVPPHLTWNEALVLSMSSFHGRGFFTSSIQLGDTYAQLAAVEALVGLLIEITFIATFTQRFFAR